MKFIWFFVGFMLCARLNANVAAFGRPAIDTRAPAYFAHLIGRSDYVVIPVYDSTHGRMGPPIVVRDRARLDELARIFEHAVYQPTSPILAVLADGPITFYAADKQRVLSWAPFGGVVRLNDEDYRIDKKSSAALAAWLKKTGSNG